MSNCSCGAGSRLLHRDAQLLQLLVRQAPDRRGGHAELDRAARLEPFGHRRDGERGDDELAVGGARDEPLAAELGQRVIGRAARDAHELADRVEAERLTRGQLAAHDPSADVVVGVLVLLELETAELPAEVGQRRAVATGRVLDLAEEDRVRAAGHLLDDAALQVGQRVVEERLAGDAADDPLAGELVALAGEAHRRVRLPLGEDVDGEVARGRDRLPGRRRLVQADQQHRRLERQRAHGARRRAVALVLVLDGDHRHAAREAADDVAELVGVQAPALAAASVVFVSVLMRPTLLFEPEPDLDGDLEVRDLSVLQMAADRHELEPVEVAQGLARLGDGRADGVVDALARGPGDLDGSCRRDRS